MTREIFCKDMQGKCPYNMNGRCVREIVKMRFGVCLSVYDVNTNGQMTPKMRTDDGGAPRIKEVVDEGEWKKWEESTVSEEESSTSSSTGTT